MEKLFITLNPPNTWYPIWLKSDWHIEHNSKVYHTINSVKPSVPIVYDLIYYNVAIKLFSVPSKNST